MLHAWPYTGGFRGCVRTPPSQSTTRSNSTRSRLHTGLVAAGHIQAVYTHWPRKFRDWPRDFTEKNIAEYLADYGSASSHTLVPRSHFIAKKNCSNRSITVPWCSVNATNPFCSVLNGMVSIAVLERNG